MSLTQACDSGFPSALHRLPRVGATPAFSESRLNSFLSLLVNSSLPSAKAASAMIVSVYLGLPLALASAPKPVLTERCESAPLPANFDPESYESMNQAFKDAPRIFFSLGKSRRARLKRLLADGDNPNVCINGGSVLSYSADAGDAAEVAILLDGGADPDRPLSAVGDTPLFTAIGLSHFDVAELLLARGADIGFVTDGGLTPLHMLAIAIVSNANRSAQLAMAKRLLDAGIPVDARQLNHQSTALMLATARGNRALVDLLLRNGADPSLTNTQGRTALDIARNRNDAGLIDLLLKSAHKQ